ncbi:MAG: efflux RND transporter permease subunit [Bacteroidota bacterium]
MHLSRVTWALALIICGMFMLSRTPLEWTPEVELPVVRINAVWSGAFPRAVERYVAVPIEQAVQRVPGTARVETYVQEGSALITVSVAEGQSVGHYVAQLNEQLALVRRQLPDRVVPRLTRQVPEALRDQQGFMTWQLIGPQAPDALRELAEAQVAPSLRSLPGLEEVEIRGGQQRALHVVLDPARLSRYGVTSDVVQQRLRELTQGAAYGELRGQRQSWLLLTEAEADVRTWQDLPVYSPSGARLLLSDLGTVRLGAAPLQSISRIDGKNVVTLTLSRAPGSHLIRTAERVYDQMAQLEADLPSGTLLDVADDRSEDVRAELDDLKWRGGIGLLLVLAVLTAMLRSARAVVVVLISVLSALSVAFIMLNPLGLTLNVLTIAGLALVFGLLVDNAVVVAEQIMHGQARGLTLGEAVREAKQAVMLPLVGGTLSTIAVLAPLVYLSGELRTLFLPFGVLVSISLGASLLSALVVIPAMSIWLKKPAKAKPRRAQRKRLRRVWRAVATVPYRVVGRFRWITLTVLLLALGAPLWLLPQEIIPDDDATPRAVWWAEAYNATIGAEAVREVREWLDPLIGGVSRWAYRTVDVSRWSRDMRPEVSVRIGVPPGVPIATTDSLIHVFEAMALRSSAVERTLVNVSERSASLRVQFTEAGLETAEPYALRERLIQRAVNTGGVQLSVGGLIPEGYFSGGGGSMSGYRLVAYGPNYDDLEALSERLADQLKSASRRVAEVNINAPRFGFRSFEQYRQFLRLRWGAEEALQTGVSGHALAAAMRPVLNSRFPVVYADLDGTPKLPIYVRLAGTETIDVTTWLENPLPVTAAREIKLDAHADVSVHTMPHAIERIDQQYRRHINVDYRGPFRLGREFLERELAAFTVPAGYRMDFSQSFFFTEDVQSTFGWLLLATLFLVYLVTAAVFESWRLPLVVLASVPMAIIGVGLGFIWTDAVFAEGAFIGAILLVGIAVNDSILLVDRYRTYRARRPHGARSPAIRLAVRDRLRPMWTTTLTSVAAMLPLLVMPGESEFWIGLAVTVTGGLIASTLLAPLATVALLAGRKPMSQTSAKTALLAQ